VRVGKVFAVTVCAATIATAASAADGFKNYDGDTFNATFRMANIDTPEITGKCAKETQLAVQAREFTRAWLSKGHVVIKQANPGEDRYRRILVTVERNGDDLGLALIAAGLARPWDGRRHPWC
jgi:micrococcal nuclease